jgi:hypothetical protein
MCRARSAGVLEYWSVGVLGNGLNMIENDNQLQKAREAVRNLEVFLEAARKTHPPAEYKAMSEPILLELQSRESEIVEFLASRRS